MYNAANRKDVREAEKIQKFWEQQKREWVAHLMSTKPGRQWMHDLLEVCHIWATSYSDIGGRMAFMEGQREIGLRMVNDIMQGCPDQYVVMMREANERRTVTDTKDSNRGDQGRRADDGADDDTADVNYTGDPGPDGDYADELARWGYKGNN